jgi:2-C-methyl-D-erythritol 4-phosphate cytidylyltransferase
MTTKYWLIIPAAGSGERFGADIPKQYLSLNGKPVIEHTVAKFLYHPLIAKIVIVIAANDYFWQQLSLNAYGGSRVLVTTGGSERVHSVYAGMQVLAEFAHPQDFVLVHDAVRPCIHQADVTKLIDAVGNHPVGGILASRVRDTLKQTNEHNEILTTVARENIWQALTPQMFRFKILMQALTQIISERGFVTDEAKAIEALGLVPLVVEGRRDNIKITFSEDLTLAEKYCH